MRRHADSTTPKLPSSHRDWAVSQPHSQPYLEVVEFIIAQNLVVILVREVENPGQCSCTRGSQLQGTNHGDKNRALPSEGLTAKVSPALFPPRLPQGLKHEGFFPNPQILCPGYAEHGETGIFLLAPSTGTPFPSFLLSWPKLSSLLPRGLCTLQPPRTDGKGLLQKPGAVLPTCFSSGS